MNETETHLRTLRRRFRAAPPAASWLRAPRRVLRFLVLSVHKARADSLGQKSAALAFTTLVSLVPLLAVFSYLGASWVDESFVAPARERPPAVESEAPPAAEGEPPPTAEDEPPPMAEGEAPVQAIELLVQILPYSEEKIVTKLEEFLDGARAIRGLGFAFFVGAALMLFTAIEEAVNRIWNVRHRRSLRSRLLSVSLVLFWGSLVISAVSWSLFVLSQSPVLGRGPLAALLAAVPFAITLLGLTMLYWQVPYTSVRFRSALAGGFTAALLLEGLRQGFGLYVDLASSISIIYGSFGFALLFMVSIQVVWWIVLLGSEAAYCLENIELVSEERRDVAPAEGGWVALAALVLLTHRFRQGQPIARHEVLAEGLRVSTDELGRVLQPLLDHGVLAETGGDAEGYLLAGDPHEIEVARVLEIYEEHNWQVLAALPPAIADSLEKLRAALGRARQGRLEDLTVADLATADATATVPAAGAGVDG